MRSNNALVGSFLIFRLKHIYYLCFVRSVRIKMKFLDPSVSSQLFMEVLYMTFSTAMIDERHYRVVDYLAYFILQH
jgi:hypothetical protein